jgi:DNA repair exonuclease SbcCD ATPase subunit
MRRDLVWEGYDPDENSFEQIVETNWYTNGDVYIDYARAAIAAYREALEAKDACWQAAQAIAQERAARKRAEARCRERCALAVKSHQDVSRLRPDARDSEIARLREERDQERAARERAEAALKAGGVCPLKTDPTISYDTPCPVCGLTGDATHENLVQNCVD